MNKITMDNLTPYVYVTYPVNNSFYSTLSWLNYTVNDTNLNKCWYYNTTENVTAGLCSNFSIVPPQGNSTYIVYANDSANNINFSRITFWVDSFKPTFQSFSLNASSPKKGESVKWNITLLDNLRIHTYKFAHNNTGTMTNSSATVVNAAAYNAYNTQTVTQIHFQQVCGIYWLNDTLNWFNSTNQVCYNVSNSLPVITSPATILPATPIDTDILNCTNLSTSDTDGDAVILEYDWYNGSSYVGIDNWQLGAGNTTAGQTWSCKITANDTYNTGNIIYSGSVTIGGGAPAAQQSPTINWTNVTTSTTGVNSTASNPTNNNSWLNLSLTFNDVNADDLHTVFFCKDNQPPSIASNCPGGTFCRSVYNKTGYVLSCRYDISTESIPSNTYYAYVLDNNSGVSASLSNTFYVNYFPSISYLENPGSNSFTNDNTININYSGTDVNDDLINYTIYNSTDNSFFSLLYTGNNSNFTWVVPENKTYYVKAYTKDKWGYSNYINSSSSNFTLDQILPYPNITSPTASQVITTSTASLSLYSDEQYLSTCNYSLWYASPKLYITSGSMACNGSASFNLPLDTSYYAYGTVIDLAGNQNTSNITFSRDLADLGGGGGGGSTPENHTEEIIEEVKKAINESGVVGDGICSPQEAKLGPLFSADCPPDFGEIYACLPIFGRSTQECKGWVFAYSFVGVLIVLGGW